MSLEKEQTSQVQQQVRFEDNVEGEKVEFMKSSDSYAYTDRSDTDLSNFLKRPTLIDTQTWTTASAIGPLTFAPWNLFLNNTYIKNKIQNYAYIRGNLHIKAVINASPFYYGAVCLHYVPYGYENGYAITSSFTGCGSPFIPISQEPHIMLYPQTNSGGEMVLPFFYPHNYLSITSSSATIAMGTLGYSSFVGLNSANGATTNSVTVQIYAWMEDVVLTGTTVSAALQAKDEYSTNSLISAPATAVAGFSKYFTNVPVIGKYAKATEILSTATASTAKLFGWSNPEVIDDVKPIKFNPLHGAASAHISTPFEKLTLDPKAEVSVDPTLVNAPDIDELAIVNFVTRESYLTQATWESTAAIGDLLFTTRVNPTLTDPGSVNNSSYAIQGTPMALMASHFRQWRGDIIFRFKIICTKYHSGRLRISWDPVGNLSASTDYTNVAYTTIFDISATDEIEFRVPYMQAVPWLYRTNYNTKVWSTSSYNSAVSLFDNGTLTVRILNDLSAPIDTSSIYLLVYARGAENLELAVPYALSKNFTPLVLQSEPIMTSQSPDDRYLINHGECVASARLLLRRMNFLDSLVLTGGAELTDTDEAGRFIMRHTRIPATYGFNSYHADGLHTSIMSTGSKHFQYTTLTTFHALGMCFAGHRGGVRYQYTFRGIPDDAIIETHRCDLYDTITLNQYPCLYSQVASTSEAGTIYTGLNFHSRAVDNLTGGGTNVLTGAGGMSLNTCRAHNTISVTDPYRSTKRFQGTDIRYFGCGKVADDSAYQTLTTTIMIHPAVHEENYFNHSTVDRYFSIGEDFNFFFFVHVPTLYYNTTLGTLVVNS